MGIGRGPCSASETVAHHAGTFDAWQRRNDQDRVILRQMAEEGISYPSGLAIRLTCYLMRDSLHERDKRREYLLFLC